MFNKYKKGQYEYASYHKVIIGCFTFCMYALSAAIYAIGYYTTGSNKNLLTIVAVLGILPASKMLISFIMNTRVKPVEEALKKEFDDNSKELNSFYHMYFTSYDTNYIVDHCIVTRDSFIGYSSDSGFDEKKFLEHMEKHMKIEGIQGIVIKIFTSKDNYINRLSQLSSSNPGTNDKMLELIMNITL